MIKMISGWIKDIGIALLRDAPNTEVKIPIRNPIAMNIPCITELMDG